MSERCSRLPASRHVPISLEYNLKTDLPFVTEFSDKSVLDSEAYQSLTSWYNEALEPMVSHKERRPFKFYKDYEPTAALKN
jgi:hypothetical protein